MFTITSTRIVGLIAVVCAFVVAPQALAATSTHSRIFLPGDLPGDPTHNTVSLPGDPSDVIQRYELRGELSDQSTLSQPANNTPGGIDLSDLKSGRVVFTEATHKSVKAGSTAAAIKALQRRSVGLDAVYRKLFPGAYRHAVQKRTTPTNPGWGAAATAAKKSASLPEPTHSPTNPVPAPALDVKTAPVVCNGQAEYEYIYAGCEG